MLNAFFEIHDYLVEHANMPIRRQLMDEIDWNDRLIAIKGGRGAGKTDFLLCRAREIEAADRVAREQRLAVPRRVYTLSQLKYVADRVKWLWDNRTLIGGLQWVEEPSVLRFFFGRLKEIGYWQEKLAEKFRTDFGESL